VTVKQGKRVSKSQYYSYVNISLVASSSLLLCTVGRVYCFLVT